MILEDHGEHILGAQIAFECFVTLINHAERVWKCFSKKAINNLVISWGCFMILAFVFD